MTESLTTRNVTEILKSYIEKIALDLNVSESTLQRSFDPLFSNLSGISAGGASLQDAFTNVQVSELSNAVTYLEQLIKESLGDVIVEGFFVRPTDPPSNKIRVYPGICYVSGRRMQFMETITFTIDLQSAPRTHFVYVKADGVMGISPFLPDEALALAKIERPSSYAKVIVEDHDFISKDAYIVDSRDVLFDNNTLFDDQTKAALRNITTEILAKNLIGTIVISENLRIENTQGSLDMDSKEIRIKDPGKNILSKFNANGVFFYNSSGEEFSHFGRNNARVGNIKITPNTLESVNFSEGASGFRIKSNGDAEFNDVTVRGHIEAATGTIDGWSIQTGKLTGGNIDLDSLGIIRVGTENNIAILDSTHYSHRLWIGNQEAANAPFSITKEGALKSISGQIGGFNIGSVSLSADHLNISTQEGGKIEMGGILLKGQDSSAIFGSGISISGVGSGTVQVGNHISLLGANSGRIEVGASSSVVLDGDTGGIIATVGQIAGWSLADNKFFASNIDITSASGGSIRVGDILLTGSASKIDVGTAIDIIGTGSGRIDIASVIDINGATGTITLSGGGSFVAGDATLNSQGLTIDGTYSSVSVGSGNSIVKLNNTHGIYLGHESHASAPFSVSMQGHLKAILGQIGGWTLEDTKLFSDNVELSSSGGGVITVGDIVLTGSTSKIDVGTGIDILGDGSGRIDIASVIDINGATGTITLSGGGSFVAGDATLNSQGLVVNGTYSSVSVGSGNNIVKLNNTHGIYLGHADQFSAPFSVTMQGVLKSISGQIGGWDITSTKLSSTNVELKSDSGGSIKVGNITLTGSTSKIDVGLSIDIDGSSYGLINVGTGVSIDGEHQKITLSNTGSLVAGDSTLNSQGLTISGTYSSISLGTGNNVIRINNSDGIYLGHTTKTSAPFWVNMQGDLISTSGSIGNWSITSSTLRAPSDAIVLDATNKRIDIGGKIRLDGLNERAESINFQSGVAGWRLDGLGNAEFQNAVIRGRLHTSVFVKDEVHASNGQLLVTDAAVLKQSISSGDTKVYISDDVFSNGDRLRIKTGLDKDELLKVTATGEDGGGYFINVTRNLDGNGAYSWEVGTAIVSVESRISLVASGYSDLPYIDAIERTSDSNEVSRARFGNLAGISGASGYGLWSENVFLTGKITATSGEIAGWVISGSQLKSSNDKIILDSSLKKITANTIVIDGENNKIDIGSSIDLDGAAGGKIIVGTINDVYLDGATGKLFAKKGEVGGWLLSPDSLISDSDSTPIMSFLAGSSARITVTDGSSTHVILGKYDGSNYGLRSGDATLNSSGLTISGTTSSISIGTGNSILKLNNSDGIFLGHSLQASAPFSVTMAGALKAISGLVGGWTLNSTTLSSSNVELNAASGGSITVGGIVMTGSTSRIDVGSAVDIVGTGGGSIQVGGGITMDGSNQRITLSGSGQFIAGDATLSSSSLTINGTSSSISLGTGNAILKLNNTNGLYLGNATQSLAPFSVTMAGYLKAISGLIGGWTLSSTKLSATNIELNSSSGGLISVGNIVMTGSTSKIDVGSAIDIVGTGSGSIQIGSGISIDGSNQRITLSDSGQFVAGDATLSSSGLNISGTSSSVSLGTGNSIIKINNSDGLFLGNAVQSLAPFSVTMAGFLKALSGNIGGWSISSSQISSSNVVLNSNGILTIGTGNDVAKLSSADGTYRIWAGHDSSASAPFKVDKDGKLFASNADIQGLIKATSGYFGTSTNGWDINSNKITAKGSGLLETSNNPTAGIKLDTSSLRGYDGSSQRFKLGTDGSGFLGSSDTFTWNTAGNLTIGGFNVGNASLTAGSGSNSVGVSASGTYAFYAGNTNPASAPFKVTFGGQLTASNAVITGDFVCNVLTATTQGNIAGWDISASALTANSNSKIQTSSGASSNGLILDNTGLRGYGSGIKKFEITANNGRVFATEADIGRKIVKITSTSNIGTAINDAISYFGSEGGIIYIPDGTYRVNTTINLADNITIKGAGPTRTRLEPSTNLGNMFNISWNVDNVEITDLELRGKNISYGGGPYTANYCIRVTASGGIDNIRLRNCSFRDAQTIAVDFSYAGREIVENCIFSVNSGTTGIYGSTNVLNCEFSGSGTGVNACATVKNCEFNNMGLGADSVLHLENNRFFGCSTCYFEGTYSERTLIQNNLFYGFTSYGVRMNSRNFNAIIANNIFQNGSGTVLYFNTPFGVSVTNNNVFECNGSGVIVSNSSTETSDRPCIYIKGNNFYRCNITRFMDVNLAGYPEKYNSCDISNNGFHHCKGSSLTFIETYDGNATICNNLIVGPEITNSNGDFVGIEVSDNYNTVVGNVISNLKVPSGYTGFVIGIYDITRHSTIVGNSISLVISGQYDLYGIYNWGGSYNYTTYVGNNLQIQNSGSGVGKAFKVNISEGTAVGNQISNSDANGDLSISSGVVASNSMV